ncbi:MAG: hypothetical protein H7A09_03215 [Oceanospirillaceae bacterium]|nr:hypothetical protein [Oceanospirillaceae bacterium]MCP5336008.1 hypothetical protein [Oceanospirillaceae bacterium]
MKEELSYTIEFIDSRFDLKSELPEDSNNCYGKDVAIKIRSLLNQEGLKSEVTEEGWGWGVEAITPDKNILMICVYPWGFLEAKEGKEEHLWRLRVLYFQSKKLFLFASHKQIAVPDDLISTLKNCITANFQYFISIESGVVW